MTAYPKISILVKTFVFFLFLYFIFLVVENYHLTILENDLITHYTNEINKYNKAVEIRSLLESKITEQTKALVEMQEYTGVQAALDVLVGLACIYAVCSFINGPATDAGLAKLGGLIYKGYSKFANPEESLRIVTNLSKEIADLTLRVAEQARVEQSADIAILAASMIKMSTFQSNMMLSTLGPLGLKAIGSGSVGLAYLNNLDLLPPCVKLAVVGTNLIQTGLGLL